MEMPVRVTQPLELGGAIAKAGVDPTLEGQALQAALRSAIADRRGYVSWDLGEAGWLVVRHYPHDATFHGRTFEEALAWCLVWLMTPEIGSGPLA
jgi:hypothetical protein